MGAVMMFTRRSLLVGALAISTLGITACSDTPEVALQAETASFDIVAGEIPRLMVGVSDKDGNSLTGGTVQFRLRSADGGDWSTPVPAESIGVPGRPAPPTGEPQLRPPSEAVGVYSTGPVTIPGPGFWEIEIDAGKLGKAMTAFTAYEAPQAVGVGSMAPKSTNPTVRTPGIKPAQLDSLTLDATSLTALTHPELHQAVIADSIAAKRPIAIVVATPAYCSSRFCGPLVDEFAKVAPNFPEVDFVHLEVFPDGYEKPVSVHAAQWIAAGGVPSGQGNEPWVFVVDRNGAVAARFDNVVELAVLREELAKVSS
jgi:hypothetical protein